MAESVFEAVKQSITVREAAQMYGIEVNRSGMACCPFHDDKNPSMKLNEEYFYCFGCGATGDVIDFTARLYNLSPKEAAEKLAQDFGLAYDSQASPRRRYVRQKSEAQKFKEDRDHTFRVLADYFSGSGRLLSLAPQVGNGLYTQNTGGKSTPPVYGINPTKGLCGLSAGFFSGGQPGGTKAVDCRTSIRNCQFGKESEIHG